MRSTSTAPTPRRHRLLPTALAGMFAAAILHGQPPMQTYRHTSGVSFDFPQTWQLREQGELLLLVPPDLATNAQGQPVELLMLGAQEAEGIASPADPAIGTFFAGQLGQLVPGMRPTGTPTSATCGLGPGAVFAFEGRDATGVDVQARVLITLHDGTGVFVAHLFPREKSGARDAEVARVFASLQLKAPSIDPALVGTWRRSDYVRTPGLSSTGSMSNTTYLVFVFDADGSFAYIVTSRTSGNTADLGVIAQSSGSDVQRGRWRAAGGQIRLNYESGLEEHLNYSIVHNGAGAMIGVQGGRARLYDRVR